MLLDKVTEIVNGEHSQDNLRSKNQVSLVVLDQSIVSQLRELGGDSMIREIFEEFIQETDVLLASCLKGVEIEDYQTVLGDLHTLKGTSGTLGMTKLSDDVKKVETKLKKSVYYNLKKELEELKNQFEEFKNTYEQQLKLK